MPRTLLPPDPRHGQRLPTGRQLARALRSFFARWRAEVVAAIRAGEPVPDLQRWLSQMVRTLTPIVGPLYRQGARQAVESIGRLSGRRVQVQASMGRQFLRQKREPQPLTPIDPMLSFDIFNPRIEDAIKAAVLSFCQATIDTMRGDLDEGLVDLRGELLTGLRQGESGPKITARVRTIFNDSARAARIAVTEASRAVHGGQLIAARETGVVEKRRWLASADACKLCLDIDGDEVGLDEPFVIDRKARAEYALVWHPPRHPHCMCATTLVL